MCDIVCKIVGKGLQIRWVTCVYNLCVFPTLTSETDFARIWLVAFAQKIVSNCAIVTYSLSVWWNVGTNAGKPEWCLLCNVPDISTFLCFASKCWWNYRSTISNPIAGGGQVGVNIVFNWRLTNFEVGFIFYNHFF